MITDFSYFDYSIIFDNYKNEKESELKSSETGMSVAFSADGMHFKKYSDNPVIPAFDPEIPEYAPGSSLVSDVIDAYRDPLKEEYLIICKIWQNGFPGHPANAPEGCRRLVGMTTSKDYIKWNKTRVIVLPDPNNGLEEFYGFKPIVRGNLYIGFLRILRDDLPANPEGPVAGIGWTELITSRDGINWTRHQEKFLDRNPQADTWDHAMAWLADDIIVGDKEYIYYAGIRAGHKIREHPEDRNLGVAFLRKNGFVSLDVGKEGGLLITYPAILPGNILVVNANVQGKLRVRLVDVKGNIIPGYDWNDCIPVRGDLVSHQVKWRNNLSLPKDKYVSIEFSMRNTELYGFSFD